MNGSTLLCNIVPEGAIPENATATFDSEGRLLVADVQPGFCLPDTFRIEVEEGAVVTVIREGQEHVVSEDDREFFISMVFG
jgi:hypothetical protein